MVSDEFFLLSDPFTVEALLEDTMLACFPCEMAEAGFALPLRVPARSTIGESRGEGTGTSFFGGGVGGAADLRAADFRDAEVDAVEAVERVEAVDTIESVLFVGNGASFLGSAGDDGGRLIDTLDAVDATRVRGAFCEGVVAVVTLVPVVLTLAVETEDMVDTRRERAAEEGVASDLAVSKLVEPSLVVDMVEAGLERLEVGRGRSVDVPAIVLRTVAWERADLNDAVEERGWELSLVEAVDKTVRLVASGLFGGSGGECSRFSTSVDRVDMTECRGGGGVNFESGRVLAVRREVVATLTREIVE